MILNLLSNPALLLIWVIVIVTALTVHEFAHAFVGSRLGDTTAEALGRLTLNPLAHIDPMGFVMLLLLGFGWAKPVPFNPYNLNNPRWDAVKIALAGPGSNLLLSLLAAVALRILLGVGAELSLLHIFLTLMVLINLFLLVFNLIPIHPLDGSKLVDALLTAPRWAQLRIAIATYGPQVLMLLVIISILTPFDVFFFVSAPSFAACDAIVGTSCTALLSLGF
ncbi:MAG: site-2 protease family protein [bacterium]|nr:site-2 protease family protein [bacterium]